MSTALIRLVAAGDMSDDITSDEIDVSEYDIGSVQFEWTGSPVGTFKLEANNGPLGAWVPYTMSAVPTAAGAPDDALINLLALPDQSIRLKYTAASGTGVLEAWFSGKE